MKSKFIVHIFIIALMCIISSSNKNCTKSDIGKMILDCNTSINKREGMNLKIKFSYLLLERDVHSK